MRRLFIISMIALVSWGCASTSESVVSESAVPVERKTLSGEWVLQQMNGEPLDELTVSLEIQDTQVSGVGFCNNYNTTIAIDGASITIDSAIGATKMMCPEGDTMQREQTYFETLGKIKSYVEVDGRLELHDETGTPVLVYQR